MRDTDCDLTSVIVVRSDADIKTVADLRGKRVGVGAIDSPQATLIPLNSSARSGPEARQRLHGAALRRARRQARRPHRRRARRRARSDGRRGRRGLHDRRQPPGVRARRHAARRPHARARADAAPTTTATSPSRRARRASRSSASSRCCSRCRYDDPAGAPAARPRRAARRGSRAAPAATRCSSAPWTLRASTTPRVPSLTPEYRS